MTTKQNATSRLSAAGVSIWLDDLSRSRIESGGLEALISSRNVVGVTTNPTIFAAALTDGTSYDGQIAQLAGAGASAADAVFAITTTDVARACDIFSGIYEESAGRDGRVSIEVDPRLAHNTQGTLEQAQALYDAVGRPNVLIKIPATPEGLQAITEVVARGISVNVTLIFSLERYEQVIDSYLLGLEMAQAAGKDLSTVHSVASFFVSRVDLEIDRRLYAMGGSLALALTGQAGIANARLAYQVYQRAFGSDRAVALLERGAHKQRPLWASTGVKDPTRRDTRYVEELVAVDVINTMPEKTLDATFDHGDIRGDTITSEFRPAREIMEAVADSGVSYSEVTALLENEGVDKFIQSWDQLLATVETALRRADRTTSVA